MTKQFCAKSFSVLRPFVVGVFLILISVTVKAQSCNCPPVSTCAACDEDIVAMTLKYTGVLPAIVTVTDGGGHLLYGPSLLLLNQTFSFTSDPPGQAFRSHEVNITGALDVLGTPLIPRTINTKCEDGLELGKSYGLYSVVSAASLAGPLCCKPSDMESVPPVITCPANINVALAAGECQKVVTWANPIATDNCTVASLTSVPASGSLFSIGTTPVTYTATDAAGNTSTCTFNVTVSDVTPPVITGCPSDINVSLTASECTKVVTWTAPTVNSCATITSPIQPGATFNRGTTPVTYTATDAAGNTSTCTFNVIVTDNTAPVITGCPSDINVSLTASECTKVVTWTAPTVNSCATITSSIASGATFNRGTTPVTYTATDAAGNTSTCTFNVIVTDNTAPVITGCPSDINVSLTASECTKVVTWTAPTVNSCATSTSSIASGATFNRGTTPVTYTATDAAGNTSTCTFNVIVTDNTPPVITGCPSDINVSLTALECSKIVTWTAPTVNSCATLSTLTPSGSSFALGTTPVTYTATDAAGNTSTCSFNVTVTDVTAPVITGCPSNINVSLTGLECSKVVTWIAPTVNSCATLSTATPLGSSFPLGTTQVTYTATDVAGNTSTCSFNVTVSDVTAPVITGCPSNINVSLTALECSKVVTWTAPTVNSCATITSPIASGATFNRGTTPVTYTATDAAGNTSTCTFNVIVTDNTAPVITGCPSDINVSLTASECTKVVTWTAPTVNSCATITSSIASGATFNRGTTPVTYTATDAAGNTSTCTFNVIVTDNTAPVITGCPSDINVSLTASECTKVVTWTAPTVNSCATITSSIASGATFNRGTTPVTYTATDAAGNTSTCTFNVIVTDNTAPVITGCPSDINVSLTASECTKVVTWTAPTVNSCATITSSIASGATFNRGTTPVTYTATDAAGNTSTCTFNVIVTDNTPPVITGCPSDINVSLTALECSKIVTWTAPTVNSCATLSTLTPSGSSFALGTTPVTYTATDAAGNTSTCSFNVTVTDVTAPVITGCPSNINVSLTALECSKLVTWIAPTVNSCATLSTATPSGSSFALGTTQVTYTATDASGNTSTCSFNVTVSDVTPPIITGCPSNINVSLTALECSKVVTWTAPTVNSCATITSSIASGATFNRGTTPVTYTATDAAGNTSTCTFNVNVTDNTAPVITGCPSDINVSLTASECAKVVTWTAPTVNSCATITSPIASGATFNRGTTPVTYTATDASGNTSTCTFNVIVSDATAPEISDCPSDFEVELTATESAKVVSWMPPTINTACTTMTSNYQPGTTFVPGVYVIRYTAVDAAGNSAECSFTITVKDKIPPVFSNYVVEIEALAVGQSCAANVTWTQPTITDNCGVLSWNATHEQGDPFEIGVTRVTYEALDVNGNISTCDINIVVKNGILPVIVDCPEDVFIKVGESGEGTATWTPPTATIPCGDVTLTSSHDPGDTFVVGITQVEYVATDAAGEFLTCTFNVVVAYEDFVFDIGKVVTPDGNSINDFWELGNIEKFNDNKVVIVDRWGGLIFSANGYNNGNVAWRGTNMHGTLVPTGTYFYTVSVRFRNSRVEKKGFIELIR